MNLSSTTQEVARDFLNKCHGAFVRVYGDGDVRHMSHDGDGNVFLSSQRKIGICERCQGPVVESLTQGYFGYCPEHDEDLYKTEIDLNG